MGKASRSLGIAIVLALVVWLASTEISRAQQAPATISGRAVVLTITNGGGSVFSSSGSYRFLASATDNTYGVIGIVNVSNSLGTISSYASSGSTGTVTFVDSDIGVPAQSVLTFNSANSGTFQTTVPSAPGNFQSGTFVAYNGQAPASVAGWRFQISIDAGISPFASNGTAQLLPATSGNTYSIVALSGGVGNSSGTYTYALGASPPSSSMTISDSVLGSTYS